jgi:lipopolysaccharide/colanic/teichoic acid biosynthesis glycosyltransferase
MSSDIELSVPAFFQGRERYSYAPTDHKPAHWSWRFRCYKPAFDIGVAILALPFIASVAVLLAVLNPWLNPGPVFFVQERLGRHRTPFRMIKFRTMTRCPDGTEVRAHDHGLEHHRITPFGRFLRTSRLDELPNFLNVLKGEMSVIGPRPDAAGHAAQYLETIPHYAFRYLVRPGITGLAQVEMGYAEGVDDTARKAHYDQLYVETSCGRLDVWIAWRTIFVMLTGHGAR